MLSSLWNATWYTLLLLFSTVFQLSWKQELTHIKIFAFLPWYSQWNASVQLDEYHILCVARQQYYFNYKIPCFKIMFRDFITFWTILYWSDIFRNLITVRFIYTVRRNFVLVISVSENVTSQIIFYYGTFWYYKQKSLSSSLFFSILHSNIYSHFMGTHNLLIHQLKSHENSEICSWVDLWWPFCLG